MNSNLDMANSSTRKQIVLIQYGKVSVYYYWPYFARRQNEHKNKTNQISSHIYSVDHSERSAAYSKFLLALIQLQLLIFPSSDIHQNFLSIHIEVVSIWLITIKRQNFAIDHYQFIGFSSRKKQDVVEGYSRRKKPTFLRVDLQFGHHCKEWDKVVNYE
jgi:hypothetical protein